MTNVINADKVFYEFHCANEFYGWKDQAFKDNKNRAHKLISDSNLEDMWDMILNDDTAASVNYYEDISDKEIDYKLLGSIYFNVESGQIYGEIHYHDIDLSVRQRGHAVVHSVAQATVRVPLDLIVEYQKLGYVSSITLNRCDYISMESHKDCIQWGADVTFDDHGESFEYCQTKRRYESNEDLAQSQISMMRELVDQTTHSKTQSVT
ncbi:hypothetical protein INT50_12415 [Vibrio diabolicus]|uniref:hypothetical protein n=1 Tax=Vibrio diabolicus TaxID=50719 RepID=UPI0013DFFF26|nr:hypothetical protein [Vibrio diabolicus]QOV29452.1 hypothetical protein INT50_12415 [Vibrio diabolicus]